MEEARRNDRYAVETASMLAEAGRNDRDAVETASIVEEAGRNDRDAVETASIVEEAGRNDRETVETASMVEEAGRNDRDALPPDRAASRGTGMNRWLVVAAPALALAFLPPACIGTESGNPRCAAPECPVDLDLDLGPFAGEVVQVRGFIDGTDAVPLLAIAECSGRPRYIGELRWSTDDATREADGSLTVRPTTVADVDPSWVEHGGRWLVADGALTITPDASVSGDLFVVGTGVDAAAADRHRLHVEGELDVICRDGEPGVALGAADGSEVVVRCNSTHVEPEPCDDTPSGC